MELTTVWFSLIAVLWIGYFVLEGFDFGVGMLLPVLSRNETERRVVINTIGPVWDGNEVWVLVAGGATFAAFPEWYATLFSGFYLPLLLILVALIVRGLRVANGRKLPGRTEWLEVGVETEQIHIAVIPCDAARESERPCILREQRVDITERTGRRLRELLLFPAFDPDGVKGPWAGGECVAQDQTPATRQPR
jgi:hypothetical protein